MSDPAASNFPSLLEKTFGAVVAFACGDAAGWPFEDRANAVARKQQRGADVFFAWQKRSGGRFRPHEETISRGEYSDDTQLMLCTARSVLNGRNWLQVFTDIELPTWSIYQRGAGGATLRAVDAWLAQTAPWSIRRTPTELRAYFDAGGNGAAMRIAPHVITHTSEWSFAPCATDILRNAITTHGHPRALLGAAIFGYALWLAFRQQSIWPYGGLIATMMDQSCVWANHEYWRDLPEEWLEVASRVTDGHFSDVWHSVTTEVIEMLRTTLELLTSQGALLDDLDVLKRIGALDKSTNGAGTVTACGAIYFAARYAAEPLAGLRAAATAERADTDTLAAMSAALLGAINGGAWLGGLSDDVQDATYLRSLAARLIEKRVVDLHRPTTSVTKSTLARFTASLSDPEANLNKFPDGRSIDEIASVDVLSRAKTINVLMWRCRLSDGQSVYIKRYEKKMPPRERRPSAVQRQEVATPVVAAPIRESHRTHEILDRITQEVWLLENDWRSFKYVSGEDPGRVDVLNATAPAFFYRWQQLIYDRMLLGITRLFDRSRHGTHENVSLTALVESFVDASATTQHGVLHGMLTEARSAADACIQHSRKRIIHRDRHTHVSNARTLPSPTMKLIDDALADIRRIVAHAYQFAGRGSILFDVPRADGDVEALLRRLTNRRSQKAPHLRSAITVNSSRQAMLWCAFCGESVRVPYYPGATPSPQMTTRHHYDICDGVVGCETVTVDTVSEAGERLETFLIDLKVPTRSTR